MDPSSLPDRGPARWLALALNLLASVTLFALMIITCVDVVGRYVFSNPLTGSTELTEMALCILIFAAFPVISWRDEHIVVDMLDRSTPPFVHLVRTLVLNLVSAAALYFIGERIFTLGNRSLRNGEVSEYLSIPLGWTINFIAAMCWLSAIVLLTFGMSRALRRYFLHKAPEGTLYR